MHIGCMLCRIRTKCPMTFILSWACAVSPCHKGSPLPRRASAQWHSLPELPRRASHKLFSLQNTKPDGRSEKHWVGSVLDFLLFKVGGVDPTLYFLRVGGTTFPVLAPKCSLVYFYKCVLILVFSFENYMERTPIFYSH